MAEKRIYRYARCSGSSDVYLHDEMMGCTFPMSADNSCFLMYMALSASDKVLALEFDDVIPVDVTASDLHPQPVYMPTGSHP